MYAHTTPRERPASVCRRIRNLFQSLSRSSDASRFSIDKGDTSPPHAPPVVQYEPFAPLALVQWSLETETGIAPPPHSPPYHHPIPFASMSHIVQPVPPSSPPEYLPPAVYNHAIEQSNSTLRNLGQHIVLAHTIDSTAFQGMEMTLRNVEMRLRTVQADLREIKTEIRDRDNERIRVEALDDARFHNRRTQPILRPVPGPHGEDMPVSMAFPERLENFFRIGANIQGMCNFYNLEYTDGDFDSINASILRLLRHLGLYL